MSDNNYVLFAIQQAVHTIESSVSSMREIIRRMESAVSEVSWNQQRLQEQIQSLEGRLEDAGVFDPGT